MYATSLLLLTLLGAEPAKQIPGDAEGSPPFAAADLDFFEKKVRPLLVQRCYECHGGGEEKRTKGGLELAHRQAILTGGDSGPAAVPGKPDESLLVEAIRYGGGLDMPPSGKLLDAEIAILTEWVQRGVPFPAATAASTAKRTIDFDQGRQHWAFLPAQEQLLPAGPAAWQASGRIDRFLHVLQAENRLAPAPPARREVLARRVTFDLVGLPPSGGDAAAFLDDPSPDAYERLVDRNLASPHFGERWGRHWLDLTRYCDVGEAWREGEAQSWLYRDWVIAALNADLPYDDFVRQQLAADLLPDAVPQDNAALGFLGLSPVYWKELKLDHKVIKQVVAEEWEEQIEALTGTFLGLTAACARCHDHKFDPISQRDYYALAGVLASIRIEDRPVIPEVDAAAAKSARAKVKELQREIDKLSAIKMLGDEDRRWLEELRRHVDQLRQTPHFDTPVAPGISEARIEVLPDGEHRTKIAYRPGEAQNVAMQIRGSAANEGPIVPRRYLEVLAADASQVFKEGSGRRELAEAIVTDSASLTARVIVNRVWQWHFGRGLVTTPSNFGAQGDKPSHPELLDDLAARFIAGGWSLKRLHREMMTSQAYRQRSDLADAGRQSEIANHLAIDPENVYLWRMVPRRLEIEVWRDAMLVATGEWNAAMGGPPEDLNQGESRRRTVYGKVHRRELCDLQRLHDFPDPIAHSANRIPTLTPLAQLFALNSQFMQQRSGALAARLLREAPEDTEDRLHWMSETVFGRPATTEELAAGDQFLAATCQDGATLDEAWRQLCQVYLGSNELLFVD